MLKVPYHFLLNFGEPTWREIAYGLTNSLLSSNAAIEYAAEKVAKANEPDPDELAIMTASNADQIQEKANILSIKETNVDCPCIAERWMCILIAWLHENNLEVEDRLNAIEKIYADFDYPCELAPFVRYMPNDEPDLGSKEKNEARMIKRLEEYIARCKNQRHRCECLYSE